MADPSQQLAGEDIQALHELHAHLTAAGDPRADKVSKFLSASGAPVSPGGARPTVSVEQQGGPRTPSEFSAGQIHGPVTYGQVKPFGGNRQFMDEMGGMGLGTGIATAPLATGVGLISGTAAQKGAEALGAGPGLSTAAGIVGGLAGGGAAAGGPRIGAGLRAAGPELAAGAGKVLAGETLGRVPGLEWPSRLGLSYPGIRQAGRALGKGASAFKNFGKEPPITAEPFVGPADELAGAVNVPLKPPMRSMAAEHRAANPPIAVTPNPRPVMPDVEPITATESIGTGRNVGGPGRRVFPPPRGEGRAPLWQGTSEATPPVQPDVEPITATESIGTGRNVGGPGRRVFPPPRGEGRAPLWQGTSEATPPVQPGIRPLAETTQPVAPPHGRLPSGRIPGSPENATRANVRAFVKPMGNGEFAEVPAKPHASRTQPPAAPAPNPQPLSEAPPITAKPTAEPVRLTPAPEYAPPAAAGSELTMARPIVNRSQIRAEARNLGISEQASAENFRNNGYKIQEDPFATTEHNRRGTFAPAPRQKNDYKLEQPTKPGRGQPNPGPLRPNVGGGVSEPELEDLLRRSIEQAKAKKLAEGK